MAKQNKHLEHLEDDILNNGSSGGKTSVAFLKSLARDDDSPDIYLS